MLKVWLNSQKFVMGLPLSLIKALNRDGQPKF